MRYQKSRSQRHFDCRMSWAQTLISCGAMEPGAWEKGTLLDVKMTSRWIPFCLKNIFCRTDLLTFSSIFISTDERYDIIRKETQQVPHGLPSMWKGFVPYSKEDLFRMCIPSCQKERFQLGAKGKGSSYYWNWTYALHEDHDSQIQAWIQRRWTSQEANCQLNMYCSKDKNYETLLCVSRRQRK